MILIKYLGLGCRSGSYMIYASLSTLIWILLLASSILSHYVMTSSHLSSDFVLRLARVLSIGFRRIGKLLAVWNSIWIVVSCMFQFTNYLNRCYCNSSVIMWKERAYHVLELTPYDIGGMRSAWIGGVFLGVGTALIFVIFVNLFINPRLPTQNED
jgi:hypothetical protein